MVCVPGLSRQGRDFDFLAEELSRQGRRVVCPDLPGRGRSTRLASALLYVFPQYCADLTTVTYATGAQKVDWVGTSLGGLIGIVLAGMPGNRIRRLVVNDIGPSVPHQAEVRIGERLDRMPQRFKTFGDAIVFFRDAFSDYGAMDNIRWHHIVRHSIEWSERDCAFNLLYDRSITTAYHLYRYYTASLWAFWRNIQAPILIVVGEKSKCPSAGACPGNAASESAGAMPEGAGSWTHADADAVGPGRSGGAIPDGGIDAASEWTPKPRGWRSHFSNAPAPGHHVRSIKSFDHDKICDQVSLSYLQVLLIFSRVVASQRRFIGGKIQPPRYANGSDLLHP